MENNSTHNVLYKCPITGKILNKDYVEFSIAHKKFRVCCKKCMYKIINIYNYLQS